MKLWKKLSLVTTVTLFLATGVSGAAVIGQTLRYNVEKTTESYRQQLQATAYALGRDIGESELLGYSEATRSSFFNFLMKKYGASRYILTKEGEVLCNLTDFELVNPQDERWAQTEPDVDTREVEGKRLLIMGKKIPMDSPADYRLVLVADISQVYRDMEKQVMLFLEFYLAAAVISVLFIFLLTRRMLSPLRELQKAASDISEGVLNRRARVKSHDEIGEMAGSFNRMADRIEEQVTQLEQVSRQQKQLLGSLTHELKTPMTSIIGYSDTLLHVKVDEERQNKALLHIHEECRRLERLSGKLMSLIGLYDNDSIRMEEVDIEELFAGVAQLEKYQLEEKGMRLETRAAGQKRMLDRDLFESFLINLIDNAVKAGKEGDSILLEATEGGISVTDHGKGIPEEEISRVTEAFYMVDKSRSKKAGGIGLGLALCSQIAALHHGRLHIESKVGQGTRVSILFE